MQHRRAGALCVCQKDRQHRFPVGFGDLGEQFGAFGYECDLKQTEHLTIWAEGGKGSCQALPAQPEYTVVFWNAEQAHRN